MRSDDRMEVTRDVVPVPVAGGDGRGAAFQVRIHGRGGQGVVAAAEILSMAAFDEGRYAQAFPSFGSERMGAPVVSYCRIDDRPIRTHEPITEPDALVVQDATLVHQVDVFAGLSDGAFVLVNTSKSFEDLGLVDLAARLGPDRAVTCPATALALEHLGRPLPNAALLGGFAALTGRVSLGALEKAMGERFPGPAGVANATAARAAYGVVADQVRLVRDRGVVTGAAAD
jgi:pyruvate ferredoxin oxidoreductase gamma subunit